MPKPPSDARLIDAFLDMVSAERGAAENTLAAYRRDLGDWRPVHADLPTFASCSGAPRPLKRV